MTVENDSKIELASKVWNISQLYRFMNNETSPKERKHSFLGIFLILTMPPQRGIVKTIESKNKDQKDIQSRGWAEQMGVTRMEGNKKRRIFS